MHLGLSSTTPMQYAYLFDSITTNDFDTRATTQLIFLALLLLQRRKKSTCEITRTT